MKKKTKIIIGLILMILIGIIFYISFAKFNQNKYGENVKNLYLNNSNNEINEIPSQGDE